MERHTPRELAALGLMALATAKSSAAARVRVNVYTIVNQEGPGFKTSSHGMVIRSKNASVMKRS